jgi:hypothetical protein
MDMAVESRAHASLWHDEKSSSPRAAPCDDEGDDILLDMYFDHSQPLDSSALDALLETNFDDDDSAPLTCRATAANWRPAHPAASSQAQQFPSTKMEPLDYLDRTAPLASPSSSQTYHESRYRMYGLPAVNAISASGYHGLPMAMHPPSPYDQQAMVHHAHQLSLNGVPIHYPNGQYFATPSPVALPTMSDVYREPVSHANHSEYQSPGNVSPHHHNIVDLRDYENAIAEEDETGGNVDPCYAQLLYKCLKDAPDHTMALKKVYEWVLQHSQKARDSPGTGWQNSVRHNLSMNAVSS